MPRLKKEPFFPPFEAKNLLPFRKWIFLINKETLRGDAAAAFTNAAVVLPQAIAFAAIAGLPPQYGLMPLWSRP